MPSRSHSHQLRFLRYFLDTGLWGGNAEFARCIVDGVNSPAWDALNENCREDTGNRLCCQRLLQFLGKADAITDLIPHDWCGLGRAQGLMDWRTPKGFIPTRDRANGKSDMPRRRIVWKTIGKHRPHRVEGSS